MTKRIHDVSEKSNKKPKLDDDINALWGDDIDDSILDDCIKQATQVFEEGKFTYNSFSIRGSIPNYNAFKEPVGKLFSSTQLEPFIFSQPGTSKDVPFSKKENQNNLRKEFEQLQQKYQEREGEVSILRTQLKETKTNFNVEQNRVQTEWKKKLVILDKQVQSVKSELEFKNLEIVNLKQKLLEVAKRTVKLDLKLNVSKHLECPTTSTLSESVKEPQRLNAVSDTIYPMARFDVEILCHFPKNEKFIFECKGFKSSWNVIPYLQNRKILRRICFNKCDYSADILPVLQKLICSTEAELNSSDSICNLNKVVIVVMKLLEDLYKLLEQIKSNLKTENILHADATYMRNQMDKNCCDSFNEDEIGFNASVILDFLSKLIPYNQYLNQLICENGKFHIQRADFKETNFQYSRNIYGHDILNKIVAILKLAGEIRKSDMSRFLSSSVKLFLNICRSGNYISIKEQFCNFTKQLIFLRPSHPVIYEITLLFKEASLHSSFVEFLLNKSKHCSVTKRGIVYFNTDACRFYIFVLMFEKCLFKFTNVPLQVCLNLLCFIYNTFKTSYWIYHQNVKECECLPQLYKIILEILFRGLVTYREEKKVNEECLNEWDYLIKNKIIITILSLMTFHSFDLAEKYITVLAQYKEIEKYLEEDGTIADLEQLSIIEELPDIPQENFAMVNL